MEGMMSTTMQPISEEHHLMARTLGESFGLSDKERGFVRSLLQDGRTLTVNQANWLNAIWSRITGQVDAAL